MMKILRITPLLCLLFLGISNIQAQKTKKINIPPGKIEGYINEVYLPESKLIGEGVTSLHEKLANLLSTRVYFLKSIDVIEKAELISSQPLFNKYNQDLESYTVFSHSSFNPLRYNLSFWGLTAKMYRLDNTDYYLVIEGQNFNPKN